MIKRMWYIASGLFLLPFGIIISAVYIIVSLLTFHKPKKNAIPHLLIKGSANRIKAGVTK